VNGYLRALQVFWACTQREGFIEESSFSQVQIPKAPRKVMPTFTEEQLRVFNRLLARDIKERGGGFTPTPFASHATNPISGIAEALSAVATAT